MIRDLVNMSNKEAATVLRNILGFYSSPARGSCKTQLVLIHTVALTKAIALLENTPD